MNNLETFWTILEENYKKSPQKKAIIFHEEKKEEFFKMCEDKYEDIQQNRMKNPDKALDVHKKIAIAVYACLNTELMEYKAELKKDQVEVVLEKAAVDMAFSYLKARVKEKADDNGLEMIYPDRFEFPIAFSCNTLYPDILVRLLFYQREKRQDIDILMLANQFFLVEYIHLLQQGIDPVLLK